MTDDIPTMIPKVISSRPARSDTAVVFCCNDRYFPFAMQAADQLARLHCDRTFDILICDTEPLPEVPSGLSHHDFRLCQIEVGDLFEGLRLDAGATPSVYLRLALPLAFAESYRRIVYLDADVFIRSGNFAALFELPLGGHSFAAVRDNFQWRKPRRKTKQFKRLGLPWAPVFNSGLLVLDPQRFISEDFLGRCLALGRADPEQMIRHDQNLMNAVAGNAWTEISPVRNWQYTIASRLFEAMEGAHVLHFIRSNKPWNDQKGRLPRHLIEHFQAFRATHFPENAAYPQPDARPIQNTAFIWQLFFRHLSGLRAMQQYLARFPEDISVVHHGSGQ